MLYICATPIGNLGDVTLRVLDVLAQAEIVACEDTRHTGVLLKRYGIQAKLMSFHDHNEEQRLEILLPLLEQGKEVALVSDAGLPGLSDPGFKLVRACAGLGLPVTILPGPSAVTTALVVSGLPSDRFAFVGFLARGRAKLIEQLAIFDGTGATVVAFESPRRLRNSIASIGDRWPERQLAVCRELTKLHEEVVRGRPAEVLGRLAESVRGEIVIVLEPYGGPRGGDRGDVGCDRGDANAKVRDVLARLADLGVGTKTAAGIVCELTGLSSRQAYSVALDIKKKRG